MTSDDPRFASSPPAQRLNRPRWLDLRLVAGVLLVLGSVVAGSRLMASADDTFARLAATTDLQPGMQLTQDLVVARRVRLDDADAAYFAGPVPSGYVVTRAVAAGELVPRSAVAPADRAGPTRYLTVAIPDGELPGELAAGDLVDVWTLPTGDEGPTTATMTGSAVTVVGIAEAGGPFGGSGGRGVTLALRQGGLSAAAFQDRVAKLVAAARAGSVYLTAWPHSAQDAG